MRKMKRRKKKRRTGKIKRNRKRKMKRKRRRERQGGGRGRGGKEGGAWTLVRCAGVCLACRPEWRAVRGKRHSSSTPCAGPPAPLISRQMPCTSTPGSRTGTQRSRRHRAVAALAVVATEPHLALHVQVVRVALRPKVCWSEGPHRHLKRAVGQHPRVGVGLGCRMCRYVSVSILVSVASVWLSSFEVRHAPLERTNWLAKQGVVDAFSGLTSSSTPLPLRVRRTLSSD